MRSDTRFSIAHFYVKLRFPEGFSGGSVIKNPSANAGDSGSLLEQGRSPGLLPGKSQGQRSLVGYTPWDCKELDMT